MIQFIKVFAAFWAKIKWSCKYTKEILSCFQFADTMKNMHRDADTCSPVKCFKNFSFCRRSLGKTSVKNGEIHQVVNCWTKVWFIHIYICHKICNATQQIKQQLLNSSMEQFSLSHFVSDWMWWCLPRMRSCWYDFVTLLTSFVSTERSVSSGGCCVFPSLWGSCASLTLSLRRSSRLVSSLSLSLQ